MADRTAATVRFYALLQRLAARSGGPGILQDCDGCMGWPRRGLYFFFENGGPAPDPTVRVGLSA